MSDKCICLRCKRAGDKTVISYKIIEDIDGMSVKFKGQLCKECFENLVAPAPHTSDENVEQEKTTE